MKKEIKQSEISALNLKNYQLELLSKMLDVPLHSERARTRNRFYKIVLTKADDKEKGRIELLEKYGKLNEKEKKYDITDMKKFNEEWTKLQQEACIIDVLPSIKADLPIIKDILKNSKVEMNITETEIYEEIMTEIEKC